MSYLILFILFLLLAAYCWQMLLLRQRWKELPAWEVPAGFRAETKVSILVPVRNEAAFVRQCLQSIKDQVYPDALLEVILIDDHSTDETLQLARQFQMDTLSVCSLPPGKKGKKAALSLGVSEAEGELIVCTDGDCTADPYWLASIVSFYQEHQPHMICGAVQLTPVNSALSRFQALDMVGMMGITAVGVETGDIRLCNGANLAYRKEAFVEVGGYEGIDHVPSGDDVLLLNKMEERFPDKTFFLKSKHAQVYSLPAAGWNNFLKQRLRWAGKTSRQPHWPTLVLAGLITAFCFALLLSLLLIPLLGVFPFLLLISGKFLVDYLFLYECCSFYERMSLLKEFFISQIYHTAYWIIVGFGSLLVRTGEWKDRKIAVK